ncbi:MAG: ATP-binding protein [Planctomycetota bacterium]|jgi:two-component system nitrogen regulation sensor histidine kinase NtrY|nr:PAS domain-containing sensor histidine kinase [Deltaproteobacteria bacterium]MDP6540078.1 ATP-binding protein [Planctomycetota bacterium]
MPTTPPGPPDREAPRDLPAENPEGDDLDSLQELPDAERRRRRRDLLITAGVLVAIAAVVLVEQRVAKLPEALPFGDSLLFLFLNAFTVVLIVLLVYLIGRAFVKLVFERRTGTLGSHLNLKFVLALFLMAAVPMAVQYVVSSSFITASINAWFSLQMDRAIDDSREVADAYYDAWARNALHFGERIADQITSERLLREDRRDELEAFIQRKQREYNLGVVQIFPFAEAEPIATLVNPEIPAAAFVIRESAIVATALTGGSTTVVEGTGTDIGDVIRGAVPIHSSDPARPEEIVGAVVVNHLVPHALVYKVDTIRHAVDEYRTIQPLAGQIAGVYQLVLLLLSLVIVLFATWWGLRIAKGVTTPIVALAEGTEKVARGDLTVVIPQESDDEIGFLVNSFNQMTHDLREALSGLERSNTELDQRRAYMEIVLRNVDAGVVSLDADGRIGTINPAALRLLGVPPGTSALGNKLEEVLDKPELLEAIRELQGQTRVGIRESARRQALVPSGEEVHTLAVTLSLLQDDEGRPLGSVIVFDDYTQEVRAQRMAAWREVARRIAHEIKNPLTPIQLSAQRIRRRFRDRMQGAPEDAQVFDECVDTITHQVEGLKLLVNEFSNFARLPAAKPRPDDLNQLVQEAISSYAGTEGVQFETDLDASLPKVDLDRDQIRRVLTNLIDNAAAATAGLDHPGTVVLRTVYDAPLQTARLEVEDDGVGIRAGDRRRVFEPYFSTKEHGTGLGLAIVSRIVADHHGYIRVHERRPSGTRFIVELPVKST